MTSFIRCKSTENSWIVGLSLRHFICESDLFENIISSMNDVLNNFINSNKFDFIGNLHQQIIYGVDNGNTVYN